MTASENGIGNWATSFDLPLYINDTQETREKVEDEKEFLDSFAEISGDTKGYSPKVSFLTDMETGDTIRGTLGITEAMTQMSMRGYYGGIFERNQARDVYSARMQLNQADDDLYKGTILEYGEREIEQLTAYAKKSTWNLSKLQDPFINEGGGISEALMDLPIANNFNESPDDILGMPAPEGWDPDQAVELLKLKDPEAYRVYLSALGLELFNSTVSKTKNPYDFFYTLNDTVQTIAWHRTQTASWKTATADEISYEYARNFIVEGIINDPDTFIHQLFITA